MASGADTDEERHSVAAFWYAFLAATLLVVAIIGVSTDWPMGAVLILLALVLPAIQLAACLIALLLAPLVGPLDYGKVGKIMGYTFVGTMIGLAIMVIPLLIVAA